MSRQIRWGILSTANIGRKVIPGIHASYNGVAAAVCSRSLDKAQAFAEEQDIPLAFGSYEAMLESDAIDAVYNPLPNGMHAEWSVKCAEAGKPCLCEKPLACDAAEAQMMADAFEARGLLLAEAFMYRFHPQHIKARQIIADGGIGDLQIINSSFTFFIDNPDNIRLSKALAGGGLMDVGCYCVNLMRFFTGEEPDTVTATARYGDSSGVDELMAGTLTFPSGVIGHFDCGLRAHRQQEYRLKGTQGSIVVPSSFTPDKTKPSVVRHWRGDEYIEHVVPPADHYQLMAEDFADALLLGREPRFPASDAVKQMRVLDRLYAAAG